MALYKDRRDKNDYRFISLWLLIGNISNFFIDGFGLDRFGGSSGGNFIFAIGLAILFLFTVPLLLIIFDHSLGRRLINYFYNNEKAYTIFGVFSITVLLVYFVYFTIENIVPGN